MDLSIIIVNYKTEALTLRCIQSVMQSSLNPDTVQVIVVDNASQDGSAETIKKRYPQVKMIVNTENLGFSKANNIGMGEARGDYILLLNSDTVVRPDTLARSLHYIKTHDGIGALGCRVLLPDGTLDAACKRSFPTPVNGVFHTLKMDKVFKNSRTIGAYNLTYLDEYTVHAVDCVMGAYMMVPRTVICSVGMLDEDFFMYGEDVDWCYRIHQAGYTIVYYPDAVITHYKKASGIGRKNPKVIAAFYDAMGIFYKKHYQDKYNGVTAKMVLSGTQFMKYVALKKNR